MSNRRIALNAAQLAVLAWVRDGSPDGVHDDWSHRVTARALHNRGLLVVRGHGPEWSATLTEDGTYYLATGAYPTAADGPSVLDADPEESRIMADEPTPAPSPASRQSAPSRKRWSTPKPKKPGPMDQMMTMLQEADDHRIVAPMSEEARYRQLAGAAKRFGRIPEGMRITVAWARDRQCTVTLESLPAWQTRTLDSLPVPARLRDPSDVTLAFPRARRSRSPEAHASAPCG